MTDKTSIETIIQTIQNSLKKIENGTSSKEDLEILVENSKEVYERAIVLRYKAYEEQIFGKQTAVQAPEPIIEIAKDTIETEIEIAEEPIVVTENNEDETDMPFDFSLFDDSAEVVKNEVLEENSIEHISVTATTNDEYGVHEEKIVMEQVTITPTDQENNDFIAKFSKLNTELSSQIGMSKLDTLIGSFGLNERLQYINELFDGSSDAFSDAIKALDVVSNFDEALLKASTYANHFHWDHESETVEEFLIKIQRRHA